eukprot:gene25979-biopygen12513
MSRGGCLRRTRAGSSSIPVADTLLVLWVGFAHISEVPPSLCEDLFLQPPTRV